MNMAAAAVGRLCLGAATWTIGLVRFTVIDSDPHLSVRSEYPPQPLLSNSLQGSGT